MRRLPANAKHSAKKAAFGSREPLASNPKRHAKAFTASSGASPAMKSVPREWRLTGPLVQYFNSIKNIRHMSMDQELALLKERDRQRAKGNLGKVREIENEAWTANLKFIISLAMRYKSSLVDLSDLINEGNLGFKEGIEKFNYKNNVKLISYCQYWVRRNILNFITEYSRAVRDPL